MFRTLYSKLALTLAVLVVLLGVLFLMLMRTSFETQRLAVEQELNRTLAERLSIEYFDSSKRTLPEADSALFDTMMRINRSIELYRLDAQGKVVSFSAPDGKVVRQQIDLEPIRRFISGEVMFPMLGDDPRDLTRRKIFSVAPLQAAAGVGGYLYVILGGEVQDSITASLSKNQAFRSAAWLMLIGLGLAAIVGFLIFRLLTTRLERLEEAIQNFRQSGFTQRVPYVSRARSGREDEIDHLGETYNKMAERISEQLQALRQNDAARRDLVANVSHDLRTPLASLRGDLETLLLKGDALSERERAFYLEVAAKQSERLSQLVAQFFELAKLDAQETPLTVEQFLLEELAQDVLQQFALEAEGKGVALKMDVGPETHQVTADIGLVERVLSNLLANAVRRTTARDSISISVRASRPSRTSGARGARVEIEVADTGSGIPADALPHIFDRSFTLDKSRTGARDGTGLGLAIVKRIVELHKGEVRVESVVGKGSRFTFDLPAKAADGDRRRSG